MGNPAGKPETYYPYDVGILPHWAKNKNLFEDLKKIKGQRYSL